MRRTLCIGSGATTPYGVRPSYVAPRTRSIYRDITRRTLAAPLGASTSSKTAGSTYSTMPATHSLPPKLLLQQALVTAAAGAVVGPLCDGLHSKANVLHYVQPTWTHILGWPLETCWWVPPLFGVAGLILGVSYPVLDTLTANSNGSTTNPSSSTSTGKGADAGRPATSANSSNSSPVAAPGWPKVFLVVSLFVIQYWLSGQLTTAASSDTQALLALFPKGVPPADLILAVYGLAVWQLFDATPQGFAMSTLTAVCGPLVEIGLINGLHLFYYTAPAFLGVPSYICWQYFCGGPAVGLLGRQVWALLKQREQKPSQE